MSILPKNRTFILFGTGEGSCFEDGHLEELSVRAGTEVKLYRAMCEAEYLSIITNGNKFVNFEWSLEKKWFATCRDHAQEWGDWFYPNETYRILEITILKEALNYMFYARLLDNIGAAYSADIKLLNMVVRRLRLV